MRPRKRASLRMGIGSVDLIAIAKMLAALVATLALIGGVAWTARRFGMVELARPPAERRLKITETLMLDPRRRLVLVRLGDEEHLLLLSPGGDRAIAKVAAKQESAS